MITEDHPDVDAFIAAAKGLPYTAEEWAAEVDRLEAALADARTRLVRAQPHGFCLPARLEP